MVAGRRIGVPPAGRWAVERAEPCSLRWYAPRSWCVERAARGGFGAVTRW